MPGGEEATGGPSSRLGTCYLLPSAVRIAEGLKKGWAFPEPTGRSSYDPDSHEAALGRDLSRERWLASNLSLFALWFVESSHPVLLEGDNNMFDPK